MAARLHSRQAVRLIPRSGNVVLLSAAEHDDFRDHLNLTWRLVVSPTSFSLFDRLKVAGPEASEWNRLQGIDLPLFSNAGSVAFLALGMSVPTWPKSSSRWCSGRFPGLKGNTRDRSRLGSDPFLHGVQEGLCPRFNDTMRCVDCRSSLSPRFVAFAS